MVADVIIIEFSSKYQSMERKWKKFFGRDGGANTSMAHLLRTWKEFLSHFLGANQKTKIIKLAFEKGFNLQKENDDKEGHQLYCQFW